MHCLTIDLSDGTDGVTTVEEGLWHAVTLTLTGSPAFIEAFLETFGVTGL